MKKFRILPHEAIVSVETLTTKFQRLATSVGDNGLTSSFSYVLIHSTYGIKEGVNPQTKQAVQYPTIRAIKIGQKSNKVCGIAELSINSLKRTINVEDTTVDVIDFSGVLPNSAELNPLQLLETLDKEKLFMIVPNGTILASTNFDANVRPRQIFKVVELIDTVMITAVIEAAKEAGLITETEETETEETETEETETTEKAEKAEKAEKPKK